MAEYKMDPLEPVDIDIRADTPSLFRFIAQRRVPGREFSEFATSKDWGHESLSRYSLELLPPVRSYTDLRIYILMDGAESRPTRITITLSQEGKHLGAPIVCDGKIGGDGSMEFITAEATLVGTQPILK
jgi:hypothetical protein